MAPERLLLLREAHDLSQRALAAQVGITPGHLSLLEAGKRHPSALVLARLATYFRIEEGVLCTPPKGGPCPRNVS